MRTLVVLIAMLAFAAEAQAAPTWLPPVTLADTGRDVDSASVDVAMDPAGNAVAVWSRTNGTHYIVQAAYRPAGGSWSAPEDLSAAGATSVDPRVAMDDRGNAVAVWFRLGSTVQMAARPAGATSEFGAAEPVSGFDGRDVKIAMNGGGTAVIAWRRAGVAEAVIRRPDGSLGAVRTLSGPGVQIFFDGTRVEPAINDAGDAMVAWARAVNGQSVIEASFKPRGSDTWGPAQAASPTGPDELAIQSPSVALGADGSATVAWERRLATDCGAIGQPVCDSYPELAERRPGAAATFGGANMVLAAPGGRLPRVVRQSDGTAVMAWTRQTGVGVVAQAAIRPPNGAFSEIQNLSAAGAGTLSVNLAVDSRDNVIAAWNGDLGGGTIAVHAARKTGKGTFEPAAIVSSQASATAVSRGHRPRLAVDDEGNAIVGWPRSTGPAGNPPFRSIAEAAILDGAPPSIAALDVPATAATGQAVAMSASATDRMTGASLSWSFGDGGIASGAAVTHAYAVPGVYTVTVTATDSVGNAVSTTRSVQVSSPPPESPPPNPPARPRVQGVTLSYTFQAFRAFTRFSRLQVRNVPRGGTVTAICAFKGKRCAGKARKPYTMRRARGTVNLRKRFVGVRLPAGTRITVTVKRPGAIGAVKVLTVRTRRPPTVVDRCLPPGARRPQRC